MKKLLLKSMLISAMAVSCLVAYNVILDPYSVLRKSYKSMFICPNERFVKTDYILRNPRKYDSYLFGSSRVSQIPVELIGKATGEKVYNMTYISGVLSDHLYVLKLFLKNRVTVRNVIIGLDYYSFKELPPESHIRTIRYPDTLWDTAHFYYTYLSLEPDSGMLKEIRFDGVEALYQLHTTGGYIFLKKEELMKRDPAKHAARFAGPVPVVCLRRIDDAFKELLEIMDLCRKNNISLRLFINPVYVKLYLCDDIDFLNQVRTRLSQVTDYWDFSSPGPITEDCMNYNDMIHYRRNVGAMVVERMYDPNPRLPAGFGVRVTKEMVAGYVFQKKREFAALKSRINPDCNACPK